MRAIPKKAEEKDRYKTPLPDIDSENDYDSKYKGLSCLSVLTRIIRFPADLLFLCTDFLRIILWLVYIGFSKAFMLKLRSRGPLSCNLLDAASEKISCISGRKYGSPFLFQRLICPYAKFSRRMPNKIVCKLPGTFVFSGSRLFFHSMVVTIIIFSGIIGTFNLLMLFESKIVKSKIDTPVKNKTGIPVKSENSNKAIISAFQVEAPEFKGFGPLEGPYPSIPYKFRWIISEKAYISFVYNADTSEEKTLQINVMSWIEPQNLKIYINDEIILDMDFSMGNQWYIRNSDPFNLKQGKNIFRFEASKYLPPGPDGRRVYLMFGQFNPGQDCY